jgi:hypothetical protein
VFAFNLTAARAAVFSWRSVMVLSVVLGRAVVGGAVECEGQALPTATPPPSPTKIELYAGYGYFRPFSGTIATHRYDQINPGAVGSATYYFSRYLGAQIEGGAFPQGRNDSFGTVQAGLAARYPYGRFTPFVHVLGGTTRQRGPELQPPLYGAGATAGGGVDYVLPFFGHRVAVRPQADFVFSRVDYGKLSADGSTGGLGEVKAYRLSGGLVYRFGGTLMEARHTLMYSCAAAPGVVTAGDPVTVTGTTQGARLDRRTVYTWTTNGGNITGTGETANIATIGLAPGDYTVTGHVTQGKHAGQSADCSTSFTVQPPQPPFISCSAYPISIAQGGKATITAQAESRQGRPLRYSYSASAGQITGTGATATLSAGNAPPGTITVECRVDDDQRQSGTATTMVSVAAPLAPLPERRTLCTLNFARDRKRPVRVDNEAKACLDDVALSLNREAGARLEITGEHSSDESAGQASMRAMNAREYLTAEKGIDPARIDVKTGTTPGRTAEIELMPVGAPIRYDDSTVPVTPQPVTPQPVMPGATQPQSMAPDAGAAMAAPVAPVSSGDGVGVMGAKRSPDSLVLPPLPADAVPSARTHRSSAASRRASAATAASPGAASASMSTVRRHRKKRRRKAAASAAAAVPATPPQQ